MKKQGGKGCYISNMRGKILTVSLLGICAVPLLPIFFGLYYPPKKSQTKPPPKLKIVCIGDSITQGGQAGREEYSYRLPLSNLLRQQNIDVDFIGAHNKGLDESFQWPDGFDTDHEGFYGATTEYVANALKQDLLKIPPPDFALIHLGSNDEEKDPKIAVIPYIIDIITQLRTRNPSIRILIGQIPGVRKNLILHIEIWIMAIKLATHESPIRTVPLYLNWNRTKYTFDGAHPNIAGQKIIARLFFKTIEAMLP